MKIDNSGINPTQNSRSNATKSVDDNAKTKRKGEYKAQYANKDEAAVSDMARLLAKTNQTLQSIPEQRTKLVEDIRQKMLDGTYEIPIGELAQRLLPRF